MKLKFVLIFALLLAALPLHAQTVPTCTVVLTVMGPDSPVFASLPDKPNLGYVWAMAKCSGLPDPATQYSNVTVWVTFKTTNAGDQRKGYGIAVKNGVWADTMVPMLPEETFSSAEWVLEISTKPQPVTVLK